MTRHATNLLTLLSCLACTLMGCQSPCPPIGAVTAQSCDAQHADSPGQRVTVIIALSSILPGGIVGHAGIAVQDQYWDYGPQRSKLIQPIKSIRSEAGPWWDDPEQAWSNDRSLHEVLADMPGKVHPKGSLIAVIQVRVTDQQAQAITHFWQDTYQRMREGEDTYRLTARQCSSMVAWSLRVGIEDGPNDRLPRDLRRMTPTGLYESLSETLTNTAGPNQGQPAKVTLWQLDADGFKPWVSPDHFKHLQLSERPRFRLAIERLKHLPTDLIH